MMAMREFSRRKTVTVRQHIISDFEVNEKSILELKGSWGGEIS